MITVGLDFETYFDDDYSLKKLHTLEYVRDKRFLVHGAAVRLGQTATVWLSGEELGPFLDTLDPAETNIVCHNMYFDGLVLFEHYQFVPGNYSDTLSMARGLLPPGTPLDLDYLAKLFGFGGKTPDVLEKTKGLRELPPDLLAQLGEYAINDVDKMMLVYEKLLPGLPDDELKLIDLTMRWGCRPVLHVDTPRAGRALTVAIDSREGAIAKSGTTLEVLSSQPKFKEHLEGLGVEVALKKNKKGILIPALGKDDLGFRQMIADHPEHKDVFKGRMAAKSTIDVTRIKRVLDIGSRGTLPMPLKYYGAHTGRWSGHDGLNPQNFRRGSELRKSIVAPPGYVILVSDLKQIEARTNMWFCGEEYWLQIFRDGVDMYSVLAANHFQVPLEEVTPDQRFFGKTLELGLGYQMGHKKFRVTSALRGIHLSETEAYEAVLKYRNTHPEIQAKWHELKHRLSVMYTEKRSVVDGPIEFVHEAILLPNDMRLQYVNLTPTETGNWYYGLPGKMTKIYGGKMLENIIQALARIVIGEQLLRVEKAGFTTVSSTHDEILMVVREAEAEEAQAEVTKIMSTPPVWAPGLPLAVDIGYSKEYSK